MDAVRLFTGIAIAPAVAEELEVTLRKLRPLAPSKWVPVENFHITSLFIGAWPEERLNELTAALNAMKTPVPFEIAIAGLNFFPNRKVLSAGVCAPEAIGELLWNTERTVGTCGVSRVSACAGEKRLTPRVLARPVYSPHLTLARIGNENIRELRSQITSMSDIRFGTFKATEFHLFLSKPGPTGSAYSRLASFPLGRQA